MEGSAARWVSQGFNDAAPIGAEEPAQNGGASPLMTIGFNDAAPIGAEELWCSVATLGSPPPLQ